MSEIYGKMDGDRMILKINKLIVFLLFSSGLQASIILKVTNIHEIKGNMMIGVYLNEEDFGRKNGCKTCKGYKNKISTNELSLEINDLKPGWYMIAIYHDVNANEKLDTNFLGIPVEPYGCSNQMGLFGPSYEKSKFYYDGKNMSIEIKLKK